MVNKRCCGTCYWHKKLCGEWQCTNDEAEGYALETDYEDGEDCPDWEAKDA